MRPDQDHEIGANFFLSDGTSRYDSGSKTAPKVTARYDYKNRQDVASYALTSRNRISSSWTSTLRLGRSTDKSTQISNGAETSAIETTQDQYVWQNDIKLPIGTALLGVEHLKQSVSRTPGKDYTVDSRTVRSLLAGWTGAIGNHHLQANLRRDENSQFGGKTTGSMAYGYQISTAWRAHASYGTAFRAPTFNQLYFPDSLGAIYAGNPNLEPEESKNAEAGVTWEQGGQRISVIQFHNKVDNLIIGWPLRNVSKATLEGTTISYEGNWGSWSAGASIDLQRPRDDDTGKRLQRRADQQMSSHLSHRFGDWTLGGEWQLVGERYDDAANTTRLGGYGVVNLIADYRLQKDWALFARANNIFDKYYETANNYATPGANIFVGIRYVPK